MLHVCVHSDRRDKQSRCFICERRDYLYSQPEPETDRAAGSPVQSMERMGFVVVSALVVTHVDGDRRMESREDVMRACKRETERES